MGGDRINKELNMENILKQLRTVDFIMKEKLLDK